MAVPIFMMRSRGEPIAALAESSSWPAMQGPNHCARMHQFESDVPHAHMHASVLVDGYTCMLHTHASIPAKDYAHCLSLQDECETDAIWVASACVESRSRGSSRAQTRDQLVWLTQRFTQLKCMQQTRCTDAAAAVTRHTHGHSHSCCMQAELRMSLGGAAASGRGVPAAIM